MPNTREQSETPAARRKQAAISCSWRSNANFMNLLQASDWDARLLDLFPIVRPSVSKGLSPTCLRISSGNIFPRLPDLSHFLVSIQRPHQGRSVLSVMLIRSYENG